MKSFRLALAASLLALGASAAHATPADPNDPNLPRLKKIMAKTPLIDGHNDWPGAIAGREKDKRWTADLTRLDHVSYDTDIERLRQGMVGGQFWSVYVSANLPGLEQIKRTLEQVDLVKSIARRYPNDFAMARTAADLGAAHKAGKIAPIGLPRGCVPGPRPRPAHPRSPTASRSTGRTAHLTPPSMMASPPMATKWCASSIASTCWSISAM